MALHKKRLRFTSTVEKNGDVENETNNLMNGPSAQRSLNEREQKGQRDQIPSSEKQSGQRNEVPLGERQQNSQRNQIDSGGEKRDQRAPTHETAIIHYFRQLEGQVQRLSKRLKKQGMTITKMKRKLHDYDILVFVDSESNDDSLTSKSNDYSSQEEYDNLDVDQVIHETN